MDPSPLGNLDGVSLQRLAELMREHAVERVTSRDFPVREDEATRLEEAMKVAIRDYRFKAREEIQEKLDAIWCGPNDLKRSKRDVAALYGRRGGHGTRASVIRLDHPSTWQRDGRVIAVTGDPYELSLEEVDGLLKFLDGHGLAGYLHRAAETYRPGACLGVLFVRKGDEATISTLARALGIEVDKGPCVAVNLERLGGRDLPVLYRDAPTSDTDPCPFCGRRHAHGTFDGHRRAHCASRTKAKVLGPGGAELRRKDGYVVRSRRRA